LEKYPIHFAAESLDANNIGVLLESDPTLVHQTYDGQTALHLVADFIADDFENGSQAFLKLLEFDADINRPTNGKFETPFHILLKRLAKVKDDGKRDFLLSIRRQCEMIDVDSYRDGEARKLLKKHFSDLEPQFKRVEPNDAFKLDDKPQNVIKLLQLMRTDETKFVQALNNLKNDPKFENAINSILEEGELLNVAVDSGKCDSVAELLKLGAAVNRCSPGSTYTPIAVACQRGDWKILELLLSRLVVAMAVNNNNNNNHRTKAKVTDPLLTIVVKNFESRQPTEVCDYHKCFEILVKSPHIDVNEQDGSGNTALHYAVRYKNDYAIKRLLEKSAYIGATNVLDSLPIRDIAPDVLESYFDSCITTNGERPGDDQFEINFDYSCLVPSALRPAAKDKQPYRRHPKVVEELSPIQYIAETNELKYLIQHPLISSFLFLKWFRLSPIFYTNLVCYSIYCVSLISYIVFCFEKDTSAAKILWVISLLGAIYVLVREMVQCAIAPFNYFLSRENYLELGLIVLTWKVLVMGETSWLYSYKHVICAFTIIFAAAELSLLVGSLPFISISTHMVMLKTVTMSFMRGLGLYSIILVAFAFSFYTLFRNVAEKNNPTNNSKDNTNDTEDSSEDELNKFMDPGRALIKTIVMMTGEFEASSIDFDQNAGSYLIFVLFLFFMSIVVLNLLNGLAVSDTQQIKSEAELNNWLERTKLLSNYEKIMLGTHNNLM
jgi:Ion transport protein/Ankyrin repeats (many copies)